MMHCRCWMWTGSKVTSEEEVAVLRREAQMGVTVIFATLPQSSVIREYRDLRELLGIRAVIADEIPLAGHASVFRLSARRGRDL